MARLSNPLSSLCLGIIRNWVSVVRCGKGGLIDEQGTAWTRLPVSEITDQLAHEFHLEVNARKIYRALKELEEAKLIRREQRLKHRYRRDYWYTLTKEAEAIIAAASARRFSRRKKPLPKAMKGATCRSDKTGQIKVTRVSQQYLSTQIKKPLTLRGTGEKQDKGKTREERARISQLEDSQYQGRRRLEKIWSWLRRSSRPVASQLEAPTSSTHLQAQQKAAEGSKLALPLIQKPRLVERPEKLVGIDKYGREIKEVWVSGFKYLVVD